MAEMVHPRCVEQDERRDEQQHVAPARRVAHQPVRAGPHQGASWAMGGGGIGPCVEGSGGGFGVFRKRPWKDVVTLSLEKMH